MVKQLGLFGIEEQLEKMAVLGDPLVKLNNLIDWEMFRTPIESAIRKDMSKGGRPPFDAVLMFKITMLQQFYNLADEAVQYQINDRLSFMRFLGLEVGDVVPDRCTIWDFKQALMLNGVDRKLFDIFGARLEELGIVTHAGSIVDASFVRVPIRHTTKKDDEHLKAGEPLEDLPARCAERLEKGEIKDIKNVMAQCDLDARHALKNRTHRFGHKLHIMCDTLSKTITNFTITAASVNDCLEFFGLVTAKDREIKADSGYVGKDISNAILAKFPHIELNICARANNCRPLTDEQKATNKQIASIRKRVEHIFGIMRTSMGGLQCRVHGMARITRELTAKNLAYNLKRYVFLVG